jgi:hypothetical protein
MEQQQQQQVQDAALAIVRPGTDSTTRAAASQFLEQWTCTEAAWVTYCQWLQSFTAVSSSSMNGNNAESISLQLLCLQLLQSKIRREIPYISSEVSSTQSPNIPLDMLQATLSSFLQHSPPDAVTVQPACICVAALVVRTSGGQLDQLLASMRGPSITTVTTVPQLRILSNIPLEMEAVSDLSSSRVTTVLAPYCAAVLECLHASIQQAVSSKDSATLLSAVRALKDWIQVARITLSQLHAVVTGTNQSATTLLMRMVQLLSTDGISAVADEAVFVHTAEALQEALLVSADSCTDTRNAACAVLLRAVSSHNGFLTVVLQKSEWGNAATAVASLMSTFVTEEIDELITQPAVELLHLLLQLQVHPVGTVRIAVLECWLTVSEIPVADRHEHWRVPLFLQLTAALLQAVEYTDDVDEDELDDFRCMAVDVLVAAYFLLRSDYIQYMVGIILKGQQQLSQSEAALFGLTATAREVNARVKSKTIGGANSLVGQDRRCTIVLLLQAVQNICSTTSQIDNRVFQVGVAKFLGSYSPTWNVRCSADDVLRLLSHVQNMLVVGSSSPVVFDDSFDGAVAEEWGRTIRALLVACASTLLSTNPTTVRSCLCGAMGASLSTNNEECMAVVAEGCTRLIVQTKDVSSIRQLLRDLLKPVLQSAEAALNALAADCSVSLSEEATAAKESLGRYLRVVQVIIRFCDAASDEQSSASHPIADLMGTIVPFLEHVSHRASQFDVILDKILDIQQQLLRTAPELVAPYFPQTVKYVVDVFQVKKGHASCIEYIACAVEAFGPSSAEGFQDLLDHVTAIVLGTLHQHGPAANSSLIRACFEMNQRFILYCPSALVACSQFPAIVSCAVECLSACIGESESTRAVLNFLTQLFGWRALRLSAESSVYLQSVSQQLDEQLAQHGARATQSCVTTLLGGSQALWPACTECIFAIVSATVTWPISEDPESSVARQWIEFACDSANNGHVDNIVVDLLLGFAREGQQNKPKAKMLLTDFCMIRKGEVPVETLISYSL